MACQVYGHEISCPLRRIMRVTARKKNTAYFALNEGGGVNDSIVVVKRGVCLFIRSTNRSRYIQFAEFERGSADPHHFRVRPLQPTYLTSRLYQHFLGTCSGCHFSRDTGPYLVEALGTWKMHIGDSWGSSSHTSNLRIFESTICTR